MQSHTGKYNLNQCNLLQEKKSVIINIWIKLLIVFYLKLGPKGNKQLNWKKRKKYYQEIIWNEICKLKPNFSCLV